MPVSTPDSPRHLSTPVLLSTVLRASELAFAAAVAGLIGHYLHAYRHVNIGPKGRFIYTEVVAGLSIVSALIWLLPFTFTGGLTSWPLDLLFFTAWTVAFGLLVAFVAPLHCGYIWNWYSISEKGMCEKWRAAAAFSVVSALFWLLSALLGYNLLRRAHDNVRDARDSGVTPGTRRRKWYQSQNA
ncbi:MAG: hypothetical protein FRX48_02188 [Lasallia pustulata]|uniref:MARVEL domain-containing protein n=1 Tax=Lasallia pustulata TaxID=136370 RepID=A0A5M8PXP2_9LECA|nr:MAG: hypothetical protein FRX48_02188 [Lasallia pustulata]